MTLRRKEKMSERGSSETYILAPTPPHLLVSSNLCVFATLR